MLVNTNVYPHNTRLDYDSGQLAMTYSLGELINKHTYNWSATSGMDIETEFTFPDAQETSNVYGWMDENCVYMKNRSEVASDLSTGVITMNSLGVGAGNLRMMWRTDETTDIYHTETSPDILARKQSKFRYDCEASNNNKYYDSTTNHGYSNSYVPVIRLRYDSLILFCLFKTSITNLTDGSTASFGISLEAIETGQILDITLSAEEREEFKSKGYIVKNNYVLSLNGVVIKPYYGPNAGTSTAREMITMAPTLETNMGGVAWFGCPTQTFTSYNVNMETPLVYYNSQWIGGLEDDGTQIGEPLPLTSLSILNMSEDYSFGIADNFTVDMLRGEDYAPYYPYETENLIFSKYPNLNASVIQSYFTLEECMNMIASFGLYFTFDETKVNSILGQALTSPDVYLGKMYDNGRCDGTYTQGLETLGEPQAQADTYVISYLETDSTIEVEPLDPDDPYTPEPEPGPEDDPIPVETEPRYTGDPTHGQVARAITNGGVKYYALNQSLLNHFIDRLWDQPKNFYEAIQIAGKQTASIFEYINSIRFFPINYDWSSDNVIPVTMGTGAVFKEADSDDNFELPVAGRIQSIVACGTWNLDDPKYHWRENYEFLNHAPYLKMSIYLPFVGTVELDPEQVASFTDINKTGIKLDASFDVPSGSITYYVLNNDNYLLVSKTAKIAIDLPLSGNDALEQATALINAQLNTVKTILGGVRSLISSPPTKKGIKGPELDGLKVVDMAVQGLISGMELYVQNSLAQKDIPVEISSFGGVFSNLSAGMVPYITVYRQKTANPSNYGHTVGYLTEEAYKISNLTGFTICKNVDIKGIGQATDNEKAQIKQILESGFYA